MLVTLLALAALLHASQPTTGQSRTSHKKRKDASKIVKYKPVTPEQAAANRKRAEDIAKSIKSYAPKMHLVETEHFLIFTERSGKDDKLLSGICESMYRALCKQFDIPASQNIWAGKCPIYVFDDHKRCFKFILSIQQQPTEAAGFQVQFPDGFCFIVMSPAETQKQFNEVLVHEGTHAFLGRYLTNRNIPRWVNEGLAEYMTTKLVTQSRAEKISRIVTRKAGRDEADLGYIFKGEIRGTFDYGIAHSIVQFMIARKPKGFVRFIRLMKEGESESEALKTSFGVTHEKLLHAWKRAAKKGYISK
jgi:hypothetical protein